MSTHFTEIFPIQPNSIPALHRYDLSIAKIAGEENTIGGKLSYALSHEFGGTWVYSDGGILSDRHVSPDRFKDAVNTVKASDSDTYRALQSVQKSSDYSVSAQDQADFVVRIVSNQLQQRAERMLGTDDIGNAIVHRELEFRGWAVDGKPALSISVFGQLIYKKDLHHFAQEVDDYKELQGVRVRGKGNSTFRAKIVEFSGTIAERRADLLVFSKTDRSRKFINEADDETPVFWVRAGRNSYEYVASQLNVVVENKYYRLLGINGKRAREELVLPPWRRAEYIKKVSSLLLENGFIDTAFTSSKDEDLFLDANDIGFDSQVRIGSDQVIDHNPNQIISALETHGLYQPPPVNGSIKMGILIGIHNIPPNSFWKQLVDKLSNLGIDVTSHVSEEMDDLQPATIRQHIHQLEEAGVDFMLVLLPKANMSLRYNKEKDWGPYKEIKHILIGSAIPNQVVSKKTLQSSYAIDNVALGIISKLGGVPFVLPETLSYADMIVGLDVARERKAKLQGSRSVAASLQIYRNDGQFLKYRIPDVQIDGETIPPEVMRHLFPMNEFSGNRIVVHRDGFFRGNELETLKSWGNEINSTFYPVEVVKRTPPRIYKAKKSKIQQPDKGTAFIISDREAILVSSPPPFGSATPRPLRVRTDGSLELKNAIHSVLALTLTHHGSLNPPRLPITIHHSDNIAYLAIRNIKPQGTEGSDQFWL